MDKVSGGALPLSVSGAQLLKQKMPEWKAKGLSLQDATREFAKAVPQFTPEYGLKHEAFVDILRNWGYHR